MVLQQQLLMLLALQQLSPKKTLRCCWFAAIKHSFFCHWRGFRSTLWPTRVYRFSNSFIKSSIPGKKSITHLHKKNHHQIPEPELGKNIQINLSQKPAKRQDRTRMDPRPNRTGSDQHRLVTCSCTMNGEREWEEKNYRTFIKKSHIACLEAVLIVGPCKL